MVTTATPTTTTTTTKKQSKRVIEDDDDDDLEDKVMEEAIQLVDSINHHADSQPQPPSSDVLHSSPVKKKSNYGEYLRRRAAGPSNPGGKSVPQGSPDCLLGLTFVFTGELSSISREDVMDLVKRLGGRVTGAPSRKTDYVILGDMAGESKLAKVKELGLKTLDENGLFDLITTKGVCGAETKEKKHPSSPTQKASPKKKEKIVNALQSSSPPTNTLWTVRYAPKCTTELIGNHSVYDKLFSWLNQDKREHKAALLSGPPGIGKTTMAHLAAKLSNYKVLEFNASDCRSKTTIQESIKEVINNTVINRDFFNSKEKFKDKQLQRQVLIMDEVDGMSSGDRGGITELISIIKKTKIPIICCCNDRSSPKIRSLANYCLDLRLRRPDARQIQGRVQEICSLEGLKLQTNVVEELVASTHGDIRQLLNCLSTFKLSGENVLTFDQTKSMHGKDVEEGPFDATIKLLGGQYDKMSIAQRLDAYFVDSSLIPLMIYENYLKAKASFGHRPLMENNSPSHLELYAAAAEAISMSERIEAMMRGSNQEWSLAPLHGFMSCVLPAYYVHGSLSGQITFPAWFGFNSKSGKCARLLRELSHHTFSKLRATTFDFRMYFADSIAQQIINHLKSTEIDKAVDYLDEMHLCREDIDSLLELCCLQGEWSKIPANQKAAFTRKYNSTIHKLPYAMGSWSGKAIKVQDLNIAEAQEGEEYDNGGDGDELAKGDAESNDDGDTIASDKMIKEKKQSKPKKK